MDTAWPLLANAWASAVLGSALSTEFASFTSVFDQPPGGQYTGWHIYMNKDLRTLLGQRVRGQVHRALLRRRQPAALPRAAVAALDQAGSSSPRSRARTRRRGASSATAERIKFVPGCFRCTMRYANRPSGIQQVLSFGGHSPFDTGR